MDRKVTMFAAVGALALLLALSAGPSPGGAQAPQATDLNLVPADCTAFCHIRVGEFWKSEVFKKLHDDKTFNGEIARKFHDATGLRLTEITAVSVFVLPRKNDKEELPCVAILTLAQSADRATILKTAAPEGKETKVGDKTYFCAGKEKGCALHFADDRTLAVAREETMKRFLAGGEGKGTGELAHALKMAERHHVVCAFRADTTFRKIGKDGAVDEWLKPLQEIKLATLVMDFHKDAMTAHLTFTFPDEAKAKAGAETTKQGLAKAEQFAQHLGECVLQGHPNPDVAAMVMPLQRVREAFKTANLEQRGAEVRVAMTANLTTEDYAAVIRALAKAIESRRGSE